MNLFVIKPGISKSAAAPLQAVCCDVLGFDPIFSSKEQGADHYGS